MEARSVDAISRGSEERYTECIGREIEAERCRSRRNILCGADAIGLAARMGMA